MKKMLIALSLIALLTVPYVNGAQKNYPEGNDIEWKNIGFGGGGSIFAVAVSPVNPDIVFAGSDVGCLFRSKNGGKTWKSVNNGYSGWYQPYNMQDIVFDRSRPDTLYVCCSRGLFRSENLGDSWENLSKNISTKPRPTNPWISCIAIDPKDRKTLYIGRGWRYDAKLMETGEMWKSTDYGKSWKLSNEGIPNASIQELIVDPHDSSIVYAATSAGFYKSTDAGKTWKAENSGLPHKHIWGMDLQYDPKTEITTIYITLWSYAEEKRPETWHGGVYKSTDRGKSWVEKNGGLNKRPPVKPYKMAYYKSIVVDPKNPNIAYVQSYEGEPYKNPDKKEKQFGIWKTTDGGNNWECMTKWNFMLEGDNPRCGKNVISDEIGLDNGGWIYYQLITANGYGLAISDSDPEVLYFARNSVEKTTDGGKTWTQCYTREKTENIWQGNGLELTFGEFAVVNPDNGKDVFLGFNDQGLWESENGGESFSHISRRFFCDNRMNYVAHFYSIAFDPSNSKILYAGGGKRKLSIYKSEDGGKNWERLFYRHQAHKGTWISGVWDIEISRDGKRVFASVGGYGLVISDDAGKTWKLVKGFGTDRLFKLAWDEKKNTLYVSTTTNGLFKYELSNKKITKISSPVIKDVRDVAVDKDSNIYMAVMASRMGKSEEGGLYKSRDGGRTWRKILFQATAWTVAVNPADNNVVYASVPDGNVYHATQPGFYKSEDGGKTWKLENHGLKHLWVTSICVDASEPSVLYAGTKGAGFFKGCDSQFKSFWDKLAGIFDIF